MIRPLDKPVSKEAAAILHGNLAPQRCGDQAVGGRSALPQAHRPGAGVRELRRDDGGDRRPTISTSRPITSWCCRTPARWRPGHARMGHAAPADEAAQAGRSRHDAHLRRADERHLLRRLHPARLARGCVGGPLALVRTGDMIEVDVRRAPGQPAGRRGRAAAPPRRMAAASRSASSAATAACSCSTSARPHDGCDFDFLLGTEALPEPEIH